MAFVKLQQVKKHLNVEDSFTEDDEYIEGLIEVAEAVVGNDICEDLNELAEDNAGVLPAPLRHCILLLVGHFYANREPVAFAQSSKVPLTYDHIIAQCRDHSK